MRVQVLSFVTSMVTRGISIVIRREAFAESALRAGVETAFRSRQAGGELPESAARGRGDFEPFQRPA